MLHFPYVTFLCFSLLLVLWLHVSFQLQRNVKDQLCEQPCINKDKCTYVCTTRTKTLHCIWMFTSVAIRNRRVE